jgi:CRISPR/Cas system CSM-associated protein Csm3 (group 7 of RAMP superfamily)
MSRWIIRGTLTTTSPLHIGSGVSEQVDKRNAKGEISLTSQSSIALDANDMPCIPGASLKGVLGARLQHHFGNSQPDWFIQAFGLVGGTDGKQVNTRGRLEFQTALLKEGQTLVEAKQTSHARDRKTKAVANKKLFTQKVVPTGTVFSWELQINESVNVESAKRFVFDDKVVSQILGALNLFDGTSSGVCLGANTAVGFGQVKWTLGSVTPIPDFSNWLKQTETSSLSAWASTVKLRASVSATVTTEAAQGILSMPLTIPIDGPFLSAVFPETKNKGDPDFSPLRQGGDGVDGTYLYRGRSLHGALRAQAERIAHTIGIAAQDGTNQTPLNINNLDKVAEKLDPVALLFGAPGWRSVLKLSDFEASKDCALHRQEFVAIDRFTGGASEGAKFNGVSVLSPRLNGCLTIDLKRLLAALPKTPKPTEGLTTAEQEIEQKRINAALENIKAAIGLFAFTLRDLDEGDIGLGFGASAKGYGQVDWAQAQCVTEFASRFNLAAKHFDIGFDLDACLKSVAQLANANDIPFKLPESDANQFPDIPNSDQFVAPAGKSFHNPYQFVSTKKPDENGRDWLGRNEFEQRADTHHWHDRYASTTVNGKPVFSGRIVCSITTKTPTFIGAQQTPGSSNFEPTRIAPFKLGEQIAIPSTSIRGMIGSLLEAASQSSLRVLHDASLSMRLKTLSVAAFFDFISKELRPFDANRSCISPAELMFGFMQGGEAKSASEKLENPSVMAMASKVRFSFGQADRPVKLGKEVLLKILGGPKLPSPSMYFRREGSDDISKLGLAQYADKFRPRGRKFYLHAMRSAGNIVCLDANGKTAEKGGRFPWEHVPFSRSGKNNNQRKKISPIEADQQFQFHVDFENLSQTELELLCFALKPFAGFEHRIGLGKPLGLGSIQIEPLALGLINRSRRYVTSSIETPRFHAVWNAASAKLSPKFANLKSNDSESALDFNALAQAGAKATQSRDPALLRSIVLLGNPEAIKLPVHTPQLDGLSIENETFKWFSDNEGSGKRFSGAMQNIGAIEGKALALPGLSRQKRSSSS